MKVPMNPIVRMALNSKEEGPLVRMVNEARDLMVEYHQYKNRIGNGTSEEDIKLMELMKEKYNSARKLMQKFDENTHYK